MRPNKNLKWKTICKNNLEIKVQQISKKKRKVSVTLDIVQRIFGEFSR